VSLEESQELWNELASVDPMWAVLSRSDKRHRSWDLTEFRLTGEQEIDAVLEICRQLHLPRNYNRSLDFGCGLGRLTRALGRSFASSDGVDVSANMIDLAMANNGDAANLGFFVNTEPDLKLFGDRAFDLIYTNRVLQHLPSDEVIQVYLREFGRLLARDGILCFGLPLPPGWKYRISPRRLLFWLFSHLGLHKGTIYRRFGFWPAPMRGASPSTVANWLRSLDLNLLRSVASEENIILYFVGPTE
jgi:SAM-dependent methyltransferase